MTLRITSKPLLVGFSAWYDLTTLRSSDFAQASCVRMFDLLFGKMPNTDELLHPLGKMPMWGSEKKKGPSKLMKKSDKGVELVKNKRRRNKERPKGMIKGK